MTNVQFAWWELLHGVSNSAVACVFVCVHEGVCVGVCNTQRYAVLLSDYMIMLVDDAFRSSVDAFRLVDAFRSHDRAFR